MPIRKEPLGGGITALFDEVCPCQTDALLLADFSRPQARETVCDFGTGCGIIPLLWCRDASPAQIHALDISDHACALARQAVDLNGLSERVRVHCCSWETAETVLPVGQFDRVAVNPPYFSADSGRPNVTADRQLARHEVPDAFDAIAASAKNLLKSGGKFFFCHRPERLAEILGVLRAHHLEPKRLRFVAASADRKPWLWLCEAVRDGHSGITVEAPLFQNSPTYQKIVTVKEVSVCPEP